MIESFSFNSRLWKLYTFSILLYFLQSLYAWFLWGDLMKSGVILLCFFCCGAHRIINKELYHGNSIKILIIASLFLVLFNSIIGEGFFSLARAIFQTIIFYDILCLKSTVKKELFEIYAIFFGWLSLVSIIGWILFLIGVPLPHSHLVDNVYGYVYENYYLFLYNDHLMYPRFCCIFLEPGQYAMIAVVILHLKEFRLKGIPLIAIFVSLLFTLSLAGYIIMAISLFYYYFRPEHIWKFALIVGAVVFLFNHFRTETIGENAINDKIIERLIINDGEMAGNNRNSEDYIAFYNRFLKSNQVLFGDRGQSMKNKWEGGNAGYRVYIVTNGIVGTFFTFLVFYLLYLESKKRKGAWVLLLIEVLLFIQASVPFWFCVFSLYVFGLASLPFKQKKNLLSTHIRLGRGITVQSPA